MSSPESESESGREEEEEEEEEEAEDGVEAEEEEEEEEENGNEEEEEDDEERKTGENGHSPRVEEESPPAQAAAKASRKRKPAGQANGRATKSAALTPLAFPISRVRRFVKAEVDVQYVGGEAGFLIAKAAEIFLEKFVEDAFGKMADDDKNMLHYTDLASHVSKTSRYDFLADFIPETLPAATATAIAAKAQAEK